MFLGFTHGTSSPKTSPQKKEPEIFTPKIMESLGVPGELLKTSEASGVTFLALINGRNYKWVCPGLFDPSYRGPISLHL